MAAALGPIRITERFDGISGVSSAPGRLKPKASQRGSIGPIFAAHPEREHARLEATAVHFDALYTDMIAAQNAVITQDSAHHRHRGGWKDALSVRRGFKTT